VTHYLVKRKLNTVYGKFALLELKIETGRTHQIRVHLSSINHPMVGDTLYGAARELKSESGKLRAAGQSRILTLDRNFLHSAALELKHPKTGEAMRFSSALPQELEALLADLGPSGVVMVQRSELQPGSGRSCGTSYNEANPHEISLPLLLAGFWTVAIFAVGQTSDQNLPSAPSATLQENAPAKTTAANDSKPSGSTQPRPQKPSQELKPSESPKESAGPQGDSAKQNVTPPATSATPAVPAQPPAPTTPQLEDMPKSNGDEPVTTIIRFANEVRVIFTVTTSTAATSKT